MLSVDFRFFLALLRISNSATLFFSLVLVVRAQMGDVTKVYISYIVCVSRRSNNLKNAILS